MLFEIKCDAFRENGSDGPVRPPIRFHEGLNTVLGSEEGDNSIGKSTFLLIIDYCFGGETYAKSDVKHYVGDHVVCFAFRFDGSMYYFCRSVSRPDIVGYCDENYVVKESMRIKEYKEWLLRAYKIDIAHSSFRDLVSRFFRVSGKKNDTIINKPLNNSSPKTSDAISSLEKLFNLYDFVFDLQGKLKEAKEKKNTYNKARKWKFLPSTINSKAKLQENEKRISDLEIERDSLTKETDQDLLQKEMDRQDSVTQAEILLSGLRRQHRSFLARYSAITKNHDNQFVVTEEEIQELLRFFPNANIRHIREVEDFHRDLAGILNQEMDEEAKSLKILIQDTTKEIQTLEKKLSELKIPLIIPKPFLDKYLDINKEIDELESQNEAFIITQKLREEEAIIAERLNDTEEQVLQQIEGALNAQMVRFNDYLYDIQRESPMIHFESNCNYTFVTPRDDGTGTAYKSLIILDLSVLQLTPLPFIAHDSSIFKNIGDEPIDRIMELYLKSPKQIFIAFDKDNSYRPRTSEIVNETAVLKLGKNGKELFGWCWAVRDSETSSD